MRSAPATRLTARERAAVRALVRRALAARRPPVRAAYLFGSKARGDARPGSDVDVLFLCDVAPAEPDAAGRALARLAARVAERTGVPLEPWAVPLADLDPGARTPMLVDALADAVPLWPPDAHPPRLPFTPADAAFCAGRLLEWADAGGAATRRALRADRPADAARRARDDITRLAAAALLLTGETRHRRTSTLRLFEERFVRTGIVSPRARAALEWARRAYPPGPWRGAGHPPATPAATRTARLGCRLAARLEAEIVPWILRELERIEPRYGTRRDSSARRSGWKDRPRASTRKSPRCWAMRR